MKSLKNIRIVCAVTSLFALTSCLELNINTGIDTLRSVRINLLFTGAFQTKGFIVDETKIDDLNIFLFDSRGGLQYSFFGTSSTISADLWSNERYYIYVIANAGYEIKDVLNIDDLVGREHQLSSIDGMVNSGSLLMSGKSDLITLFDGQSVRINLVKCFSKINLKIDTSDLDECEIEFSKVTLKNVPSKIGYFAHSQIDMTDYIFEVGDTKSGDELNGITTTGVNFYTYENMQGELLPYNTSDSMKVLTGLNAKLCTYLEIEGEYKNSTHQGKILYRLYLGANSTSNFDIERNHLYCVRIIISGDGCNESSWRVDKSRIERIPPSVGDFLYSDTTYSSTYYGDKNCVGVFYDVDTTRAVGKQYLVASLYSFNNLQWSSVCTTDISTIPNISNEYSLREYRDGKSYTYSLTYLSDYSKNNYPVPYLCTSYSVEGFGAGNWFIGTYYQMSLLYDLPGGKQSTPPAGTVAYAIKIAGGSPLVDEMYGKIWTITESNVAQIYCYVVQSGLYFPYNKNYSNSALYVRPIMEL